MGTQGKRIFYGKDRTEMSGCDPWLTCSIVFARFVHCKKIELHELPSIEHDFTRAIARAAAHVKSINEHRLFMFSKVEDCKLC